jgi:hypothetical protein
MMNKRKANESVLAGLLKEGEVRRTEIDGETYVSASDLDAILKRKRQEELDDPELTIVRMRRAYEDQGYSPKWIDKRLRGMSARQEVVREWARRGAAQSEQYRGLTNAVMEGAFGMDVESLRRYKNLQRTTQNLRDYMNDLELVLTSLAETAAVALHRNRASNGFDELLDDAREAGRIAGAARIQIEQGSARKPRRPAA